MMGWAKATFMAGHHLLAHLPCYSGHHLLGHDPVTVGAFRWDLRHEERAERNAQTPPALGDSHWKHGLPRFHHHRDERSPTFRDLTQPSSDVLSLGR